MSEATSGIQAVERRDWAARDGSLRMTIARQIGAEMARRDRTDPFVQKRVTSLVYSGVHTPADYGFKPIGVRIFEISSGRLI